MSAPRSSITVCSLCCRMGLGNTRVPSLHGRTISVSKCYAVFKPLTWLENNLQTRSVTSLCSSSHFLLQTHRYKELSLQTDNYNCNKGLWRNRFLGKRHFSNISKRTDSDEPTQDPSRDVRPEKEDDRTKPHHVPVLVDEVLTALQAKNGQVLVDMTFGAGGHAREILKVAPEVKYIAVDRDPQAHNLAKSVALTHSQVVPVLSRFSQLSPALQSIDLHPDSVDGFLFDLGASSMQFDSAQRGFSLIRDGPLDMRMDGNNTPGSVTAADVVNTLEPHDLAHIIKKYGEERRAKEIAHAIVEARYAFGNFTSTKQLADVVQAVFNNSSATVFRHDKLFRHAQVATKTFQALRVFVNNELNELHNGLQLARHFLRPGGRCVAISFHSLEDRIVKRHFHGIDLDEAHNMSIHQHYRNTSVTFDVEDITDECLSKDWQPISRKVVEATPVEVFRNPRSRSAKLRAALRM